MEPDKYIKSFFDALSNQLDQAKLGGDGKSAKYEKSVVAATWSNELWEIELKSDEMEPMRRQYDPANARSSESAANYFVDALRRAAGQEPFPRVVVNSRYSHPGRPKR